MKDYEFQIYDTNNDDLLDHLKRIAEEVLKYYPNHIESLSYLSIVFMLQQQHDKALEQLLKAEKINPKDFVILNNIGEAYKRKDDKRNAIKYFKLTSKYGNEDAKNSAQEQIDKLKKN